MVVQASRLRLWCRRDARTTEKCRPDAHGAMRIMLENRNLKLDLLALALLAAVIFLAAALLSYDPADPPGKLVFPPHSQPANMCGYWGAMASRLLFEALGLGAYYLLVSLAAFDACLLMRREIGQPGCGRADGCSRWRASPRWPPWPCPAFRRDR